MNEPMWMWGGFVCFILAMLALDLGFFHRESHRVTLRESLIWSGVWVSLAMLFNLGVWYYAGSEKALEFFTGYVIEKSLSVDNVFVFALVFSFFAVPSRFQHKVLFWGILGALVLRGILIAIGTTLIQHFAWIIYGFGALLVVTGFKMLFTPSFEVRPDQNPLARILKRVVPISDRYHEDRFWIRENGILKATPLLLVLVIVEFTDLVFAVDSIPAIFAISHDPFIVFTSNVFAILGLRSLYFALEGVMHRFRYLKVGLGLILSFVGAKMILSHTAWKLDTWISLSVIGCILVASIVASWMRPNKTPALGTTPSSVV